MRIHKLTREAALSAVGSSTNGLDEREAQKRLLEFGPNEIEEVEKASLFLKFISHFTHFFAILLWVGAGLAFIGEYFQPNEGMAMLGWAIIAVILINAIFTFIQEYRAEKAMEALKMLLPSYAKIKRSTIEKKVLSREIVPGDIILLNEGDNIPADARVINTSFIRVNNASLTGESDPKTRRDTPSDAEELIDSHNILFAGTSVLSGSCEAVAFATGMNTEFGKIAHLTTGIEEALSPLQREIVRVTRVVAVIALSLGISFFFIGNLIGLTFWENFIFAIGIIIANVPEGLLPTVTLSLAMGSQRMAKKKALIKKLISVETLGCTTTICTDKTGTLTENRMDVEKIYFNDRVFGIPELSGMRDKLKPLLYISGLCHNVKEGLSGDPTEVALYRLSKEFLQESLTALPRIYEIPFDSDRKRMTSINKTADNKKTAYVKGAPEVIIPLCKFIFRDGKAVAITEKDRLKIMNENKRFASSALRVLALAYREFPEGMTTFNEDEVETDLIFTGLAAMMDPPRPDVSDAVDKCKKAGIRIVMITGDQALTASAIGKRIGMNVKKVMEGKDIERVDDMRLKEILKEREIIFARMSPRHKMRIVSVLKDMGEVVAVTGDGVNDAPALKMADIGIAMGIAGTDVAKEAADVILLDDHFATIVNAIEEGRAIFENIRKFITYILASNIPEIVPYIAFVLLRIPLPLTVIQILAVDLGTDMLPALALGAERPTSGIMERPPRSRRERLLNFPLIARAYLFLGPIEAAAGLAGYFWFLHGGGWQWGQSLLKTDMLYMQATTMCLTAIIVTQVANVFACRTTTESVFKIGLFSNRLILFGIAVEILLQIFIVYHPIGNKIFGTAPLPFSGWLFLIPFAVFLFLADEVRKGILRTISFSPSRI
ncbi:MAG: cation-transporting P-type ATPase [Nitrospirota bacterium]